MENIINNIVDVIWGPVLVVLLLGVGLLFTISLRFIQFRRFGLSFKRLVNDVKGKSDGEGSISSASSLATALASTVGVGNIAGVATAIAIGGPGAVFWMWLSALFGMATNSQKSQW